MENSNNPQLNKLSPDQGAENKSPVINDIPSVSKLPAEIEKHKFWENPTFLFVCMGILTIIAMLSTYFIAQKYDNPMVVIASISLVTGIITLVGGMTIKTIDELATTNRMKTEFVSIASHQLRTPLSIIKWYVEFLSKKEIQKNFTDKEIKYIKTINDSNQRMIKLVNDLLDISRIENGRMQIKLEKTNFVELCQNIIKENQPIAELKKIKISFKYDPSIPLILADPKRIGIAMDNLITNAVKYIQSDKGQGQISIEISNKNKNIIFNISDNGVGIPAGDQKKIFKKFFRANNTMRLQTSGTGLGLFIAKAIIKSHKGSIWFVSKENEGTTFYFTLPLGKK